MHRDKAAHCSLREAYAVGYGKHEQREVFSFAKENTSLSSHPPQERGIFLQQPCVSEFLRIKAFERLLLLAEKHNDAQQEREKIRCHAIQHQRRRRCAGVCGL